MRYIAPPMASAKTRNGTVQGERAFGLAGLFRVSGLSGLMLWGMVLTSVGAQDDRGSLLNMFKLCRTDCVVKENMNAFNYACNEGISGTFRSSAITSKGQLPTPLSSAACARDDIHALYSAIHDRQTTLLLGHHSGHD